MTVQELIDTLKELDPSLELWGNKDDEGNGYRELSGAEIAYVARDSAWETDEMYNEDEVGNDACDPDCEDDDCTCGEDYSIHEDDAVKVVVIW